MQRRSVLRRYRPRRLSAGPSARRAAAQDTVKIGMCLALTGGFRARRPPMPRRRQALSRAHGDEVAGRKIELIVKDDRGIGDVARRLVQEMIVNDGINIVGAGITPSALAITSLVTEAKIPGVVMISGTSIVVDRSPYLVRTGFTLGQSSGVLGTWAVKNGHKRVVTLSPIGRRASKRKGRSRTVSSAAAARSSSRCACRSAIPISRRSCRRRTTSRPTPCSSPFPASRPAPSPSKFAERGLDRSGIRIIGPGDL